MYPAPTYYAGPQLGPAPGIAYAGFWIRFLAAVIDTIIVGVPLVVVFVAVDGSALSAFFNCVKVAINASVPTTVCQAAYPVSIEYFELIALAAEMLYFVALWSQLGGTLGQRMLGLHVVDAATGRNIGIGRALGRFAGYVISSIAFDIGLIWAAFDPRKQGWHDKIASTFVVRKV